MNSIIAVVCLFATLSSVLCDDSEPDYLASLVRFGIAGLMLILSPLSEALPKICLAHEGLDFKNYSDTVRELRHCMEFQTSPKFEFELPSEVCNIKRPLFRDCLQGALPGFDGCFSADEKWFVHDFLLESSNSVFTYVCEDMFASLQELMSLEGIDCLMQSGHYSSDIARPLNCVKALFQTLGSKNGTFLTKSDFCTNIDMAEECILIPIRQKCTTHKGLEHLIQGFVEAFRTPCSL